ncbi:MAG: hypothetical protein JXA57_16300 [Armatimonadetes bacterium]|nr:hypothetical protein [Armatimonadota bacterium]
MNALLSYALLADGTSDRALLPIILWTLQEVWPDGEFAAPVFFARQHRPIAERVNEICESYHPDVIFVHRDAEGQSYEERVVEIPAQDRIVPVVPVRMTEAWLLIDEAALRKASGNPKGRIPLQLPQISRLEGIQAKSELHNLLKQASGYSGRRLKKFNVESAVHRLANLIDDFSLLSNLSAFRAFRERLSQALVQLGKLSS